MLGIRDEEPLLSWRKALAKNCIRLCARSALFTLGFWRIRISGREHLAEAKRLHAVVVINHVTYIDGFLMEYLAFSSGVAKASVATIPVVGTVCRALRFIFVERRTSLGTLDAASRTGSVGSQSMGNIQRIVHRAKQPEFPLVWMAPEGTTSSGKQLLRFKPGAFVSGNPVLPVLLKFPYTNFNVAYTNYPTLLHLLRFLTQVACYASMTVLPVYMPTDLEKERPAVYAENVRQKMAKVLGVPTVDEGLEELAVLDKYKVHVAWDGRTVKGSTENLSILLEQVKHIRREKENN
eukprot:CAMPEP_0198200788 /NCGR_PEP_ID=MMETSP1445-20131203/3727_1 /TAXON_ID=36898 /ORGANISM="Pyramimonas sp., Strain CCMP2087" /LENGTH=292 /DNA_ID=CAMNT_0043870935 /DNA_START=467 /DNA_END=1345 /DNA_ORIENTATION=+